MQVRVQSGQKVRRTPVTLAVKEQLYLLQVLLEVYLFDLLTALFPPCTLEGGEVAPETLLAVIEQRSSTGGP